MIAEFPNTDLALRPGMFATARIVLPGEQQGICSCRARRDHGCDHQFSQLYFIRDGKARLAVVQLGATRDGDWCGFCPAFRPTP